MTDLVITGNIASGKSNLADHIKNYWGYDRITEPVDHQVLKRFYPHPEIYGFETQQFFIYTRVQEIKKAMIVGNNTVSDFWRGVDTSVYALDLLETGKITEEQYSFLLDLEELLFQSLRLPDMVVLLRTRPEILQSRIRKRGRDEEKGLLTDAGLALLARLDRYHDEQFYAYPGKKAIIQTDELALVPEYDGAPKRTHIEEVLGFIDEGLHREYRGRPFTFIKTFS